MRKRIDLRSDTVTQPGPEMRRAMAEAEVGEDLYGEDRTVNLLEARSAQLLGKEAAMFVPTGTMGNLIALKVNTQPGEEVILEEQSHIYNSEMAGVSAICGLLARPVRGDARGMPAWDEVRSRIRPAHRSHTRLVCLENTHNFAGGTILEQSEVVDLCRRAREHGLRLHLDGARIANAAVASVRSIAELAAPFDSVMMSFSKGLGAPAGAVVAGSAEWIAQARRVRRLLGGAIHQPGCLAAACLHGLEHLLPRLGTDHCKAKRLAEGLSMLPGIVVQPEQVATNIVIVRLAPPLTADGLAASLSERSLLVNPLEDGRLRLVTHCDVSEDDIETALDIIAKAL